MRKFLLIVKGDVTREDYLNGVDAIVRISDVSMHRDLLYNDNEHPLGGGEWNIKGNHLILDERSYDFGVPKLAFVKHLIFPEKFKGYKITYTYPDYSPRNSFSRGDTVEFSKEQLIFKDE